MTGAEDDPVRYSGLTGEQVREALLSWAAWCGDPHPTALMFVTADIGEAEDLLFGEGFHAAASPHLPESDHVDGVVAMAIGRFENGSIGTPPGVAPPSGTAAIVVIARGGAVMHRGLQPQVPDLSSLGSVVAL